MQQHLSDSIANLESKLTGMVDEVTTTVEHNRDRAADACSRLDTQFSSKLVDLDASLSRNKADQDVANQHLLADIDENRNRIHEATQPIAQLQIEVKANYAQLTSACEQLEQSMLGKNDAQDSRVQ